MSIFSFCLDVTYITPSSILLAKVSYVANQNQLRVEFCFSHRKCEGRVNICESHTNYLKWLSDCSQIKCSCGLQREEFLNLPSEETITFKRYPFISLDNFLSAIQGPRSSSSTQNLLCSKIPCREKSWEEVESYNINHSNCRP